MFSKEKRLRKTENDTYIFEIDGEIVRKFKELGLNKGQIVALLESLSSDYLEEKYRKVIINREIQELYKQIEQKQKELKLID